GGLDRPGDALDRERVLAPHVDESPFAACRVRDDRHRLDERERVLLHEDAVLERSRLGLVGVADDVVRANGLPRDGLPLAAGGEGGAAPADEFRLERLPQDALLPETERAAQGRVAAVGPVLVEARRVDAADAGEEEQAVAAGIPGLGSGRRAGAVSTRAA